DRSRVTVLREPDFRKVGEHGHALARVAHSLLVHRQRFVGDAGSTAVWLEVSSEDFLADFGHGKRGYRSAHVAARIAILEPPDEARIEHRSRDDAKLPRAGYGVGETPIRDGHAHAALDDARKGREKGHPERSPARRFGGVTDVSATVRPLLHRWQESPEP